MIEARAIDLPQLSLTPLPTNQPTEIEFVRCHPSTPRLATPPTAAHKPPPALCSLCFAQSLEDRRCFPKAQQPDHLPFLEKNTPSQVNYDSIPHNYNTSLVMHSSLTSSWIDSTASTAGFGSLSSPSVTIDHRTSSSLLQPLSWSTIFVLVLSKTTRAQ
jgi:hypothetical protein